MLLRLFLRLSIILSALFLFSGCTKQPLAAFTVPQLVGINQPVPFTNQSVDAEFYLWDFGDGETSTDVNPNHSFVVSGMYTITLTALSDNGKKKDVTTRTIEVDVIQSFVGSYLVQQNCTGTSTVSYTMETYVSNDTLYLTGFDMVPFAFACYLTENNNLTMPAQVYNGVTYSGVANVTGNNFSIVYTKISGGDTTNCTANCTKQ
jgi:PKD repeat protein